MKLQKVLANPIVTIFLLILVIWGTTRVKNWWNSREAVNKTKAVTETPAAEKKVASGLWLPVVPASWRYTKGNYEVLFKRLNGEITSALVKRSLMAGPLDSDTVDLDHLKQMNLAKTKQEVYIVSDGLTSDDPPSISWRAIGLR